MTTTMQPETVRLSNKGIEPASGSFAKPAGTGFEDKKKMIVLGAVLLLGLGVVVYQFTLKGPSRASATTSAPAAVSPAGGVTNTEIESILKRLEASPAPEADALTVAEVERIVSEFDNYIRDRQTPLDALAANPFVVKLSAAAKPPMQALKASAEPEPSPEELKAQREAQARAAEEAARRQRIERVMAEAKQLALGSILVGNAKRLAVINGRVCSEGDVVDGFTVDAISPDDVLLTQAGTTVKLSLFPTDEQSK